MTGFPETCSYRTITWTILASWRCFSHLRAWEDTKLKSHSWEFCVVQRWNTNSRLTDLMNCTRPPIQRSVSFLVYFCLSIRKERLPRRRKRRISQATSYRPRDGKIRGLEKKTRWRNGYASVNWKYILFNRILLQLFQVVWDLNCFANVKKTYSESWALVWRVKPKSRVFFWFLWHQRDQICKITC